MVTYIFSRMKQPEVNEILDWHYPAPYNFYDMAADEEDLEIFQDPVEREKANYHSVYQDGRLIGFFSFHVDGDKVDIGLGMHPDATGNGAGLAFVKSGVNFTLEQYKPKLITLAVATFNERAIKVYERAGFNRVEMFMQATNGSQFEFLKMEYQVE